MKIILSHTYFLAMDPVEQKIMMPYPPLGMLCVSAFLEQQGVSHEVIDNTFSDRTTFLQRLSDEQPDVLGLYVNLMTRPATLSIIKEIRSNPHFKQTKILLGGPEIRYHAEAWLKHGADFLVTGEGERSFFELVSALSGDGNPYELFGIAYLDSDGKLLIAQDPEPLKVDEIPAPARHRINMNAYREIWIKRHGFSAANLNSMRGCPYSCKWCSKAIFGNIMRRRDPDSVVEEMQGLHEQFGFDRIWFTDDVFTLQTSWIERFAAAVADRKLKIPYEIITRADCLDDERIELLKSSGCFRAWVGAESGSDSILEAMGRKVDSNQTRLAIQKLRLAGIEPGTFIMLGYPGETVHDIKLTIQHLKACLPLQYTLTLAYPIKGTELYNNTEALQLGRMKWGDHTDRDIDFQRTYSRRFYDYALRWVYNEVEFSRNKREQFFHPRTWKLKAKSMIARMIMRWV